MAVFAVFFAIGFGVSANAQYVSEATARVYRPMGTLPVQPDFGGNPTMINFNQAVVDIITDIPDSLLGGAIQPTFFFIVMGANTNNASSLDTATGLPDFETNGGVLDFGQIIFFNEGLWGPTNTQITTRIYRGADGRHYMAAGEGTELPAPAVAPESDSSVIGDEFFILGDTGDANAWTTVKIISRDAIEFQPAVCDTDSGYVLQEDMISCECPTGTSEQNGACVADTITCSGNTPVLFNGMCVEECQSDETRNTNSGICEPNAQTGNNQQTQTSDGKKHTGALIFGGLMIMGAIGYAIDGDVSPFNFAPDFGYSATESGYSANAGGRIDFRKDNWHLYQFATQTNNNGNFADFRYTSGGEYKSDIWAAAFSETVQGETADYDFSLSANLQNGIWKISPVYRMHSEYEKGETETNNSLNLEGVWQINRWTITPSAGFRWENADNFTENARFRIDAVHRF